MGHDEHPQNTPAIWLTDWKRSITPERKLPGIQALAAAWGAFYAYHPILSRHRHDQRRCGHYDSPGSKPRHDYRLRPVVNVVWAPTLPQQINATSVYAIQIRIRAPGRLCFLPFSSASDGNGETMEDGPTITPTKG